MMGTTICACQLAASGVHHTTAGRPFSDRRAAAQSNAKRVRRSGAESRCMYAATALPGARFLEDVRDGLAHRPAPPPQSPHYRRDPPRTPRRGGCRGSLARPGSAPPSRALFCFSANKSFARALPPASLRPPGLSARVAARCHPLIHQSGLGGVARAPPALPPGPRAVTERRPFASHSKWIALRRSRSRSRSRAARHGTARHVLLCVLAGAWSTLRPPLPHGWCRPSSSHRARPFRQPLGVDGSRAARRVLMCFPVLGAWCTPRPTPPPHRAPLDRARATQLRTFGSYPASASSAAARAAACAGRAEGGRVRPAGGGKRDTDGAPARLQGARARTRAGAGAARAEREAARAAARLRVAAAIVRAGRQVDTTRGSIV